MDIEKSTLLGQTQSGNDVRVYVDDDTSTISTGLKKVRIVIIDKDTQLAIEQVDVYSSADAIVFDDGLYLPDKLKELLSYTNTNPVTADIGGIQKGTVFNKVDWKDILNNLTHPYVAPTIVSFTSNKSADLFYEDGTNLAPITFEVTVSKGSSNFKSIVLEQDGQSVYTCRKIDLSIGGSESITYTNDLLEETSFRIKITDNDGKVYYSDELLYRFKDPIYVGVIDNLANLDSSYIKDNFEKILTDTSIEISLSPSSQRMIIIYPDDYIPYSILDPNKLQIFKSFYEKGNVDMNMANKSTKSYSYIATDLTTQTDFKLIIEFR